MEILISFCIPVYNQSSLVKECIGEIVKYSGQDIEIIVSDDASTENIQEHVINFNDSRIKYFRNNTNLGHDLNILQALKNASGTYAFLLRSRDKLLSGGISIMVKTLYAHPEIVYLTGSALDETGKIKLRYSTKYIENVNSCLKLHFSLYIHPSGSLYRISELDINKIERHILKTIDPKFSFVAHNLMRIYLAGKGRFYLIGAPFWVYTNTIAATDEAVNSAPNRVLVYSPDFCRERYKCEALWVNETFCGREKEYLLLHLFKHYLYQMTWLFKTRNSDPRILKHYKAEKTRVSNYNETKKMITLTKDLFITMNLTEVQKIRLNTAFALIIINNALSGGLKYCLKQILKNMSEKFKYVKCKAN